MDVKLKLLSLMLSLILMTLLLAGCGGDDDADDVDTAGTTGVVSPGSTPAGTPTESPTALAQSPSASPTTEPTIEPTQTYTPEQTALLDVLLAPGDLPDGWQQRTADVPEANDSPGLCGAPPFPRASEQVAEVEAEYQSADNTSFILQNLTQFPEDVAVETMQYLRDSIDCDEFTDDSGTTFTISPADVPDLGDEAYAVNVSFPVADAGDLTGQFVYIRTGGLISIVSYLTLGELEPAQVEEIAGIATAKMVAVADDDGGSIQEEADLLGALLSADDFPAGWQLISPAGISDPSRWSPLCGAEPFSGINDAVARVSANFFDSASEDAAAVQQVIQQFPPELVEQAMAYERESASCQEWDANGTTISLSPAELPEFGDESFSVTYTYEDAARGEVQGTWIVIRSGNLISHIIYTNPEQVDSALVEQIGQAAAEKMASLGQ